MKENSASGDKPIVQQFLAMLATQPSEEACQRHMHQLDDYITAQLDGEDVVRKFPDTAVHLDTCLLCAEAYAALYDTYSAEIENQLIDPPTMPAPDLTFLQSGPSLSSMLKQQLQATANQISLQLTAALLPFLTPLPQAALVRSASGRYAEAIYSLTPEHVPDLALPFSMTAYKDLQNADLCLVEINVTPAGISWPDLEGYQVLTAFADKTISEKTDDWGTAVFANIPVDRLANLTITVETP